MNAGAHFVHGVFGLGQTAFVDFTIAADGVNEVVGFNKTLHIGHRRLSFRWDEAGMAKLLVLPGKQVIASRYQDDQQE